MPIVDSTAPIAAGALPCWQTAGGLTPYATALAVMEQRIAAIRSGHAGELVWLVEHKPLFTAGTSAKPADLLSHDGIEVFTAGRGGQWTYHGPGQRVAYVMLDLNQRHGSVRARDLHAYVDGLERWIIAAVARFGIAGAQRAGRVGIWVIDPVTRAEAKIAAIGVRITRWVCWHGIAINVAPDLSHYGGIVPCGISAHGVTSLTALGVGATMAEVDDALRLAWAEVFV